MFHINPIKKITTKTFLYQLLFQDNLGKLVPENSKKE